MKQCPNAKIYLFLFFFMMILTLTNCSIPHKRPVIEKTKNITNSTIETNEEELDTTEQLNKELLEKFNSITQGYEKPQFLGNILEKQKTKVKTDEVDKSKESLYNWEKPKYGPLSKDFVEGFHMEIETKLPPKPSSDIKKINLK